MMKVDLTGKTALVTGAGGAIGSGICRLFAENGCRVAVCDVNLTTAEKTAADIRAAGGIASAYLLDVTELKSAEDVVSRIEEELGGIDILVNNAGVNVGPNDRKPVQEFSPEKWDWIISVDLDGVFKVTRAAVPRMKRGGSIINVSSVIGSVPFRNQIAFCAAKAGVINFSKASALELAPLDIRVNVICPGSIMMEGTKALFYADAARAEAMVSHIPQRKPGKPEDIAYAALFLAAPESSYMTGSVMTVDGGWTCGYARDF